MRHGQAAGTRYYIVVFPLRATIYSVVILFLTLGIASGQQPKRSLEPQPLPLLPAESAWLVTLDAPPSAGGAMDDLRVYVPRQDEQFTALDRQTGKVVWTREIESAWPPVVGDGRVYLAASDELHALDPATGDTIWRVPLERPLLAPMTFDSGWLLAVLEQGDVIGVRSTDGREIWRQRVGTSDRPLSPPVPGEADAFYLTLEDSQVVALSLTDGHVLWEQRLSGILSPPSWARGRVFVGSTDNFLYALDSKDGSVAWKWRSGGDVLGAAADDDIVFFASLDNTIRAVNRGNGNQRWRKDAGTRPVIPPMAFPRLALIAGTSPTLSGFDAKTGTPTGTYTAPGAVAGDPLIDADLKPYQVGAVIVMRDGQVQGLYPVPMLFRDTPPAALTMLPGRALQRESR
jgi:outer membrane protein assembly factor BamB